MGFWTLYYGIEGGGGAASSAVEYVTTRLTLIGTSQERLTICGQSAERLILIGASP